MQCHLAKRLYKFAENRIPAVAGASVLNLSASSGTLRLFSRTVIIRETRPSAGGVSNRGGYISCSRLCREIFSKASTFSRVGRQSEIHSRAARSKWFKPPLNPLVCTSLSSSFFTFSAHPTIKRISQQHWEGSRITKNQNTTDTRIYTCMWNNEKVSFLYVYMGAYSANEAARCRKTGALKVRAVKVLARLAMPLPWDARSSSLTTTFGFVIIRISV